MTKQSHLNVGLRDWNCFANADACDNTILLEDLRKSPISFWIDSSGGPKHLCNQSFYGTEPKYYIYGNLNEVYFVDCCRDAPQGRLYNVNCFDFLEQKINEEEKNKDGIFVGYISYDIFKNIQQFRSTEAQKHRSTYKNYPDFFFAYFEDTANIRINDLKDLKHQNIKTSKHQNISSNMTDSEYLEKVKQIKEEIKKGNVYQVNLTREYTFRIPALMGRGLLSSAEQQDSGFSELDLYLKLRKTSPNPYGCFFKTPFLSILSSSPEEFLYIEPSAQRYIRTRPIKGTLSKNIFEIDQKNQAENIMIVDLERNDLGRICETGSVKAKKLLEVEEYEHLNHVVSTIEGKLRQEVSLRKIFEAVFPGGSITGAPKIAAMKIIDEIEPTKRGAYTGTFGYIKTDGSMNFNILIRTIFITHNTKGIALEGLRPPRNDASRVTFNIGGGIVADSDPNAELEEIKLKAKGIMTALDIC